jgi:hypothetical protein
MRIEVARAFKEKGVPEAKTISVFASGVVRDEYNCFASYA